MARTAPLVLSDLLSDGGSGDAGIHFLSSNRSEERFYTYSRLRRRANAVRAWLLDRGFRTGSEVVIAAESPETFVTLFWACLQGKFVPVPVQPGNNDEHRLKLLRIWQHLKDPRLVAEKDELPELQRVAARHGLSQVACETQESSSLLTISGDEEVRDMPAAAVAPEDIAFIQFSSGSTGDPKGVVLTHANLIAHLHDFASSAGMTPADTFLSWFPLTHDMGLIGWHLLPLFCGASQCLMPTRQFVWRPSQWLEKTSEHRATILSANNFGLKHFLRLSKASDPGWDLSSVRLLFNGAEPISARLCDEFLDKTAPYRLSRGAMFPGFGLAEATLAVTFPVPGEGMRTHTVDRHSLGVGDPVTEPTSSDNAVTLVDLGQPVAGTSVRVVDSLGATLGERHVGCIEISSRSMTRGYYNNPEATSRLFAPDGWLRTGDLGFLDGGRLVVTGRLKEVIVQGGHNYYPQDLERVAEEIDGIELGRVVACGVPDRVGEKELLVIFLHHKRDLASFAAPARQVREHLLRQGGWLVDFVVPTADVPKTTSGKIQRYKLTERFQAGEYDQAIAELARLDGKHERSPLPNRQELVALLQQEARAVLGIGQVDVSRSLFEQGLTSLRSVEFQARLGRELRRDLPVSLAFDYPTIHELADFLDAGRAGHPARLAAGAEHRVVEPIAILGMGCRFPGEANDPHEFWRVLADGVDAVRQLPRDRGDGTTERPLAGFLEDVAGFDSGFFGISTLEAESLDPQARLLLEVTWEALERAGQNIPSLTGSDTGVFVGISNSDYALAHFHSGNPDRIDAYSYTGTSAAVTAGRISYLLGLQGPALAIDTACSSSLVAVHQAAQSLRSGECDLALAAGVNLILSPEGHASLTQIGALSATGRCRSFDDGADGYVRGEGCGVVAMKRLSDALEAGDPVCAVIRGSAINHDGRSSGLTVPNGPSQARVIQRALQQAGLTPDEIDYVEAHGTGTPLGDPIEVQALDSVFRGRGPNREKLWIGSVKSNTGHLESAAGIAALIKVVLSLQREIIPRSLHFERPNHRLPWERLAVQVAGDAVTWPRRSTPRLAGVSSFGFSGTNAHVVVEEAPSVPRTAGELPAGRPLLLPVSARSQPALRAVARSWREFLNRRPELPKEDACYTAAVRRGHLEHRAVCRFDGPEEMLSELEALAQDRSAAGLCTGRPRPDVARKLAFVYSGQGSQWAGMGRELFEEEPVFEEVIRRCDALILPIAGWSLIEELFRPAGESRLDRTDVAQAGIFSIQAGLTALLDHWGVRADAVVGHSVGEVAAFYGAGRLSIEEAVQVVVRRGRAMQAAAGMGTMLAVRKPVEEMEATLMSLDDHLEVAAVNSPRSTVLSGSREAVAHLADRLGAEQISCRTLPVDFAFHSAQMESASEELSDWPVPDGEGSAARVYSTVTGAEIRGQDIDPQYWRANARQRVRFADAIEAMAKDGCTHFVEIGPHAVLTSPLTECLETRPAEHAVIPTLKRDQNAEAAFLDALAALHCEGYELRWSSMFPNRRESVELPTYSWQRRTVWKDGFHPWNRTPRPAVDDRLFEVQWRNVSASLAADARRTRHVWIAQESNPELAGALAAELAGDTYIGTVDSGARDALTDVVLAGGSAFAAISLVQILVQRAAPVRLWLVGRNERESLSALGRVISNEHPELRSTSVTLGEATVVEDLRQFARLLSSETDDREIRFRDAEVLAARLSRAESLSPVRSLKVSPDSTYLITGGYGGLGLLVARFLAGRGARNLVLLGRNGPSEAAREAIDSLRERRIRVEVQLADVSEADQVERVAGWIGERMPLLAGIVHAAGHLEDSTLLRLDRASFDRVTAPKVSGALNLDRITRDQPLDFFILASSAAVLLGSPGQGAYVAANATLDALAEERERSGRPSLSLQLGPVSGPGMSARDAQSEGIVPLSPVDVEQALESLWSTGRPRAALLNLHAPSWFDRYPSSANRRFLSDLLPVEDECAEQPFAEQLRSLASPEAADEMIRRELARIVAAVMKASPDKLETDRPLQELGIDSLMTVQIRNTIIRRFGTQVPVTSFWTYPTIRSYARFLSGELGFDSEPAAAGGEVHAELARKWDKYL